MRVNLFQYKTQVGELGKCISEQKSGGLVMKPPPFTIYIFYLLVCKLCLDELAVQTGDISY